MYGGRSENVYTKEEEGVPGCRCCTWAGVARYGSACTGLALTGGGAGYCEYDPEPGGLGMGLGCPYADTSASCGLVSRSDAKRCVYVSLGGDCMQPGGCCCGGGGWLKDWGGGGVGGHARREAVHGLVLLQQVL